MSRPRRARWIPAAFGMFLGLTGCSFVPQVEEAFCIEYESAWQDFVHVRDGGESAPIDVIDAGGDLRDRWSALLDRSGTPRDVYNMVGTADTSFESAWNASTTLERLRYQESWINGRDYIGMRCSDSGFPIEFGGDDVPVQAPRVTEP